MALGIDGPIGDLARYAMLITYRRRAAYASNRNRCLCKCCGLSLARGEGNPMQIRNTSGQWVYYYFCAACCTRLAEAIQSFGAAHPEHRAPTQPPGTGEGVGPGSMGGPVTE